MGALLRQGVHQSYADKLIVEVIDGKGVGGVRWMQLLDLEHGLVDSSSQSRERLILLLSDAKELIIGSKLCSRLPLEIIYIDARAFQVATELSSVDLIWTLWSASMFNMISPAALSALASHLS